jgi:hypothetical protein
VTPVLDVHAFLVKMMMFFCPKPLSYSAETLHLFLTDHYHICRTDEGPLVSFDFNRLRTALGSRESGFRARD